MINSLNTETRLRHIAIIGNPNSGKTTLFNALTGLRQKVGNYPGVTVDKKLIDNLDKHQRVGADPDTFDF